MKRYFFLLLLLTPSALYCQWSISLVVNNKVITTTAPFIVVDTGDVLHFTISARKGVPIKDLVVGFIGRLCDLKTQEQSIPDTTMNLALVLQKAKDLKQVDYQMAYDVDLNTMLTKFPLGALSDCKGQFIWLKFVIKKQYVTTGPAEIEYKFLIKP
jgi:hypothetical protein